MREPDAVVIGSGPNGLSAAIKLATQGLSVLVLEENARRPGGAVGSEESTLPGFLHDVGAGFFPLARLSPAFREFKLERLGLVWLNAEVESCHPALDGSSASLRRLPPEAETGLAYFGNEADTLKFESLAREHASMEPALIEALLGPLPGLSAFAKLGIRSLARLAFRFAQSTRTLSHRWFSSEAARRVLPGLALHADLGPDAFAGAAMAQMLAFSATTVGFSVPRGGAQRLTDALVTALELAGGQLRLAARVSRVLVRGGRAVAVKLENGEEIPFKHALLADTSPSQLLLELLPGHQVPGFARRAARRFRHGYGTLKIDYALAAPVPWRDENARRSATVHVAENTEDLARFTRELEAGRYPSHPYLVVGQQSLIDPSRAPEAAHTLYVYSHVPGSRGPEAPDLKQRFADSVEARLEALAPGFRSSILERRITAPSDFERSNRNLVAGDLGGGSSTWSQQLWFRPFFRASRYRMPVTGVYLCSSSTHPGGGAHGMCGYNAALRVISDLASGHLAT